MLVVVSLIQVAAPVQRAFERKHQYMSECLLKLTTAPIPETGLPMYLLRHVQLKVVFFVHTSIVSVY